MKAEPSTYVIVNNEGGFFGWFTCDVDEFDNVCLSFASTTMRNEVMDIELLTVAELSRLKDEVRKIKKERDKLQTALNASDEAWQTLRDVLDVGPDASVVEAVDKLIKASQK